jgi:predicted enzyme related to lactoylglutathione lyase
LIVPVVQSYPVHVFCHADLNTTDVQAARNFCGTLLGWHFTETQLEGQSVHNMGRIDGHAVAGLAQLPPNALEAGMHPCWAPYVHVADAVRTLAAGEAAGGTTVMPPFAVADSASIAVMKDAVETEVALF